MPEPEMRYIIQAIQEGAEEWTWATPEQIQAIELDWTEGIGGTVHTVIPKKQYDQETERKEHHVRNMENAIVRWKKKMGLEVVECFESELEHIRTEYVFRHEEWVCQKHMLLRQVTPSEEMGQEALAKVLQLVKSTGIPCYKIYYSKQGWVGIYDYTRLEPYMR